MEKTIKVTIENTPEELAEILFNMDNTEIAKLFGLWRKKFDDEYQRRKEANEPIHIFDFYHFFLWVVKDLDHDGKQFFKDAFSAVTYAEIEYSYKILSKH